MPVAISMEQAPRWYRSRPGLALVAFYLVAALHAWATKARGGRDFGVLLVAGSRALHAEPLYRLSDPWKFKYSPPVALLLAPVSLLPADVASLALALASAVALAWIVAWSARQAGLADRPLALLALVVLSAPYALHALALGQNDALLVALALASASLAPVRPGWSGALLAVAALVKPPFVLLALLALAGREWRRLGAFAATGSVALGLTAARYGVSGVIGELHSWRTLLATTTPSLLCDAQNQSLWAVVCTYVASPEEASRYAVAVAVASAGLAGLALALAYRSTQRRLALFAAALYLTAPLSPLGWRTNLVAALPALALLVANALEGAATGAVRLSRAVIAVTLALQLATYDVVGRRAFSVLLAHRHYALACAVAVLAALAGGGSGARGRRSPG